MIPSTVAAEVTGAFQDFLATGFSPSNPALASVVDDFLADAENLAKGPYLSIDLPFQSAPEDGEPFPEIPFGHTPHRHQRNAFGRLAQEQSTIVATGTGSGKTECFLYPVLEHCRQKGVDSREAYLHVPRIGWGVRLNRAARARIWPVFEEYRVQLAERSVLEAADCYRAAAALLDEDRRGGDFAAVIVDEAQDLDAPAWQLIRSLAPSGKDDLFIVGDAHQRIYSRRRVVLSHCGIDIRGRARKLRLNYRTTEETSRWAADLLEGRPIDDLDGGREDNEGLRSVAHGPGARRAALPQSSRPIRLANQASRGLGSAGRTVAWRMRRRPHSTRARCHR